jgi:hypothetical protein
MDDRGRLTKILAVVGTVLVWLPLIAPLVLGVVRFAQIGRLQIDYLMPAELFIVGLVGGALLLWAALRARLRRALIAWSLAAAVGLLVASMAVASLTGLASGAAEPTGWRVFVVTGLLAGYIVALCVLGVGGVSLARRLLGRVGR